MNLESINHFVKSVPNTVNWFDWAVLILIIVGGRIGKKHGMTAELGVSLQWTAIVAAGAFLYRPIGDALSSGWHFSPLFCYIFAYVGIGLLVKFLFSVLTKGAGGKLVSAENLSGRTDYYLGMAAGTVRFLCILLAALALLNARQYSAQEIAQAKAYQDKNYGSEFFPSLSSVQSAVFQHSFLGKMLKAKAGFLLIAGTAPTASKPTLKEYSL